jgi:hypothetical protein
MRHFNGSHFKPATSGWLANGIFTSTLLVLVVLLTSGCMKQSAEVAGQQLTKLGSFYGVQWPTNYSNGHAASVKYSALDYHDNTLTIIRLNLDEANYRSWYAAITNRMEEFEGLAAIEDKTFGRFKWYNPHIYPRSQITQFFCASNASPNLIAQLTVYAVSSNDTHILFIESSISK